MQSKLESLHSASMAILNKTGCLIHHSPALELLKKHGLKIDGNRVYFTEDQVMKLVKTAPSSFELRGRAKDGGLTVGGPESHYAPGAGAPQVVGDRGEIRAATVDDFKAFTKLFHGSANMTLMSNATVTPTDVPPGNASLVALYHLALLSDKPFWALSGKGRTNSQIFKFAEILFGERLEADKPPRLMTVSNPLSPLSFDDQAASAIFDFSLKAQAVIVAPCAMAGSTAPVTLAGTVAQTNAETLVGIALSQLVNPGAPVVYGSQSTAADMKTGAIAVGAPEQAVCARYGAELGRFYGLPSRGGGALTDASGPGAQSAYEAMLTLLAASEAGTNIIIHGAGIVGGYAAMSLKQSVLGLEMINLVRSYLADMVIDEQNLALDLIDALGPGGQFLTAAHTVKYCRKSLYSSRLAHRGPLEGPKYMEREQDRLAAEAKRLIESYRQPDIPRSLADDLKRFLTSEGLGEGLE